MDIPTEFAAGRRVQSDPIAELYAKAALIRATERRLLKLFGEGKLFGTVHTCIGQEYTGVAIASALQDGDVIFTNHRGHGHYLARTDDVDGLIGEVMGRQSGMCGGRGGSQHMCGGGVFSNGIQGGIVPVSAGIALAQKMNGHRHMTVVFVGDGTLGEGALYESLNLISKWELPLLVVLEHNKYAQSTSWIETCAGDTLARATAFGIDSACSNIWNMSELLATAASAANTVRDQSKPFFLQIDTYRLMAHSKGDDDRDPAEVRGFEERDALNLYKHDHPEEAARLESEAAIRIEAAVERAEASPLAIATQGDEDPQPRGPCRWSNTVVASGDRVVNLIHASLQRNMARDERIILIGEDIAGPYGGAFKVTKNLSTEFPGRVRNTPISEAVIIGVGNGLALHGKLPVCEIMFGDFLTLCADQLINHASKFRYMYNNQVTVPLIVRTPMGGKRGYGPTHSQSLEKHFLGLPGTTLLALHHRFDPGLIYDELFRSIQQPTIVIENKLLYGLKVTGEAPDGFVYQHTHDAFPTTRLRPAANIAPDLTILCYGGMLVEAELAVGRLFDEHEIVCEVICPQQLYPVNLSPVIESVRVTGRLLIAEEGIGFAAFGAEVIAALSEEAPGILHEVKRLSSPRHPIPSAGPMERQLLPSADHLVAAAQEMLQHA